MKLDALLYMLLGTLPAMVAVFASDEAGKYLGAEAVFWTKATLSVAGVAAGNLKAFRSQSFGNWLIQRDKDQVSSSVVVTTSKPEPKP